MRRFPRLRRLRSAWLFTFLLTLFSVRAADAATRDTTFVPLTHGFAFGNTFNNDVIAEVDLRTGGLCGGMVYAALDYYHARVAVPRQDYRPASRTTLQSFIYGRQVDSLRPNLTKWADVGLNPGGARNTELFDRAMTSEFANLRAKIDAGIPAPLGLHGTGGTTHQVLAIGYDSDAHGRLTEIRLYEPNFPNEIVRMRPDPVRKRFDYVGKTSTTEAHKGRWRTYFVDKSYAKRTPANVRTPNHPNDGRVRELVVEVNTGEDDLRGGNDNVDLIVHLDGGAKLMRRNINLGARWLSNYGEYASVLIPATRREDIAMVELRTTSAGGVAGDNWDATGIAVHYYTGGNTRAVLARRPAMFRFTGTTPNVRIAASGGTSARPTDVTSVLVTIETGGDDLRGNEDNVDATIHFRDGSTQRIDTINLRRRWADNTEHAVWLMLERPRPRAEIVGLTLRTAALGGGVSGDNWNVDRVEVAPIIADTEQASYIERAGAPLKRFTGQARTLELRW